MRATTLQKSLSPVKIDPLKKKVLLELIKQKEALDVQLKENNIWSKIYSNYHTYMELIKQKEHLNNQIIILDNKYQRTEEEEKAFELLKSQRSIITGKLQLMKEYEKDPFKKFLKPPNITDIPSVENPFAIISAISYIEKLKADQLDYESRYESIKSVMDKLKEKELLLKKILLYDKSNTKYRIGTFRYTGQDQNLYTSCRDI